MGDRRVQLVLILGLVALAFAGGVKYAYWKSIPPPAAAVLPPGVSADVAPKAQELETVLVHVTGAVANPGVYDLPAASRVVEAVTMARPLPEADMDALNLAAPLIDGQQVVVPVEGEPAAVPLIAAPAPGSGGAAERVNINTANQQELESLPGIGPALAQRIVDYRMQHGPFRAVEDIQNVSGIGPARFEQIKDLITVY